MRYLLRPYGRAPSLVNPLGAASQDTSGTQLSMQPYWKDLRGCVAVSLASAGREFARSLSKEHLELHMARDYRLPSQSAQASWSMAPALCRVYSPRIYGSQPVTTTHFAGAEPASHVVPGRAPHRVFGDAFGRSGHCPRPLRHECGWQRPTAAWIRGGRPLHTPNRLLETAPALTKSRLRSPQ